MSIYKKTLFFWAAALFFSYFWQKNVSKKVGPTSVTLLLNFVKIPPTYAYDFWNMHIYLRSWVNKITNFWANWSGNFDSWANNNSKVFESTTIPVVYTKKNFFVLPARESQLSFSAAPWMSALSGRSTKKQYTDHGHEKRTPQIACLTASAINNIRSQTFFIFWA